MKTKTVTENRDRKKRKRQRYSGVYFLCFVLILYLVLFFFEPDRIIDSLKSSGMMCVKIVPILLVVVAFMGIFNFFLNPKSVTRYIGKASGMRGCFWAIGTGILSHGPIYLWYPLLKQLREQGMRNGLAAVFLYNRAIKIPLLTVMLYYFGTKFVIVMIVYMILAYLAQRKIIDMIKS